MIDTNLLLSVAFSMLANFSNIVDIPHGSVPTSVADVEKCLIGAPRRPLALYLVDRRGAEFWINDGAVYLFRTPGNFKENQDPAVIPRFLGRANLTSNEVLALATRTLRRLVKNGDPLTNGPPIVRRPPPFNGQEVPFYEITWPTRSRREYLRYSAFVEVDARKGLMTFIELCDDEFFDYAFARQVSNRVCTLQIPAKSPKRNPRVSKDGILLPSPMTNEVVSGIKGWLWLCDKLGVSPGSQTNVDWVDWDQSYVYTNRLLSSVAPVCQVWFKNGACFECVNGVTFSHYGPDACYVGAWWEKPREDVERYRGEVVKHWEGLARDLEGVLMERLIIPRTLLAPLSPNGARRPPEFGTIDITRAVIEWRNWPKVQGFVPVTSARLAFTAEFDLQTGNLEWISFQDPAFIQAIGRAQGKGKWGAVAR